jgi:hypothetical protein
MNLETVEAPVLGADERGTTSPGRAGEQCFDAVRSDCAASSRGHTVRSLAVLEEGA